MGSSPAVQLPAGYEDAKPAGASPGAAQVQLPKGYEDAQPVGGAGQPGQQSTDSFGSEQARGRTFQNMTAAMSGQPQSTPEDQQNFEQGKKSGMESAAVSAALGAAGGAATAPSLIKTVSKVPGGRDAATGRMLPWMAKEASTEGPSLVGKIPGILKSTYDWAAANPVKAYVVYKIAEEAGIGAGGLKKVLHLVSGGSAE